MVITNSTHTYEINLCVQLALPEFDYIQSIGKNDICIEGYEGSTKVTWTYHVCTSSMHIQV